MFSAGAALQADLCSGCYVRRWSKNYKMKIDLNKLSREGRPQKAVCVGGRLHDSAIGSIYYASVKGEATEQSMVLKTLDLKAQNVWAVTRNNKRTTLRGLNDTNILYLTDSKTEAREWASTWAPDALVAKVAYAESAADGRDGARRLVRVNEYLNEAVVGLIVTEHVHLPHIVRTHDAWIQQSTGCILQDYGGVSLFKHMADLTLPEFQSVLVQVLVTLAVGQETAHLKHHDVHLDNVFINRLAPGSGLAQKPAWAYTLRRKDGTPLHLVVPHHGVLAKLGDFGLAAATDVATGTRYERVDYPILDATEIKWGAWCGTLQSQLAYDVVCLLSKFFLDDEATRCRKDFAQWARDAYAACCAVMPEVVCSTIGRPLRGREGNVAIADLLSLPFFAQWHAPACSEPSLTLYPS